MKSVSGKFVDLHQVVGMVTEMRSEVFKRAVCFDGKSVEFTKAEAEYEAYGKVIDMLLSADGMDNSLHLGSL